MLQLGNQKLMPVNRFPKKSVAVSAENVNSFSGDKSIASSAFLKFFQHILLKFRFCSANLNFC